MAESMAEGDIVRKHFQAHLANKMKSRRLKTDPAEQSIKISYKDTEPCRDVVVNTSMNQESFRSPTSPAYKIKRYRAEHFNPDRHRQPLPRSSYNRDFLLYEQPPESGIIPTDNVIMGRSSSANIFRSSYRDSFGPKRTNRVNIKELDACKDKIKYYFPYSGVSQSITAGGLGQHQECCSMTSVGSGGRVCVMKQGVVDVGLQESTC